MRALVINLDRAAARMDFQRWQLERLGLAHDRLPAVGVGHPGLEADPAYWAGWQRPIAPAERACLLSHRAAWTAVSEAGWPALILEDDALLSDDVPAILGAAEDLQEVDLLQLETRRRRKILSKRGVALGPVQMHRLLLDRAGAAGYVLWPSGAARLLAAVARRPALADALVAQPGLLRSHQVCPAAVIQNDIAAAEGVAPQWPVEPSSVSCAAHRQARKSAAQKARRLSAQLALGGRTLWGRLVHLPMRVPFAADRFTGRG